MTTAKGRQIDGLMERASRALRETDYFEAERLCASALVQARRAQDYDRLARICMPLQEVRRQRLLQAYDAAREIVIVNQPFDDDIAIESGCYILDPMLVAADARRLRMLAFERNTPVAVLCREPITQLGLQPIVALGEVVVRTKIRPAKEWDHPSMEWFVDAMEALGDAAIDEIDPALEGERLVDALLDRIDAVPEHEMLHQRLAEAAHEAAQLMASIE